MSRALKACSFHPFRVSCEGGGTGRSFVMRCFLPFLTVFFLSLASLAAEEYHVFFGTYTKGTDSEGIYRATFNSETGALSDPELAVEVSNPSFLAIHPEGRALYAASEVADFEGGGAVMAYAIAEDGSLTLIDSQASGGSGPCHLSIDQRGKVMAVANYGGGSVSSYEVGDPAAFPPAASTIQHVGSSIHPKRQQNPHAHSINFSPDGRFAYAADLGADKIFIYAVDPGSGRMTAAGEFAMEPGDGPRHFAFHPGGEFAYVINEMTLTVTAFSVEPDTGMLTAMQTISTLPEGAEAEGSTAEVVCHPGGKFLYGSNRGHDSIAVYQIDGETGKLTAVEHEPIQGKTPRNFALDPTGKWLLAAGQNSDTVAVFSVNQDNGELDYTGRRIEVVKPVCVRFLKK